MMKRTSIVNYTKINSIALSSVYQIGDSQQITPRSWVLAVQRQLQLFYGREGRFLDYPKYTMETPQLRPIENITINRFHQSPFIKVNNVRAIAFSTSSVFHIGSTSLIDSKTRIKHFRQIQKLPDEV